MRDSGFEDRDIVQVLQALFPKRRQEEDVTQATPQRRAVRSTLRSASNSALHSASYSALRSALHSASRSALYEDMYRTGDAAACVGRVRRRRASAHHQGGALEYALECVLECTPDRAMPCTI